MDDNIRTQIEDLFQTIHQLRWSDYHAVIKLGKQALEIARKADNPYWIVESLNHIAWGYNRLDLPIHSVKYAKEAVHLSKDHDFLEQFCYALVNLHYCYYCVGEIEESLRMINQVIAIAERNHFVEFLVYCYNDLAMHMLTTLEFETSIELLEKAIATVDEYQLNIPKAFFFMNIASTTIIMQGDLDKAHEMALRSYDDALANNVTLVKIYAQYLISDIYISTNDLEKALYHAELCQQFSVYNDYQSHHGPLIIGRVYTALGRYDEALKQYQDTQDMLIKNGVEIELPDLYNYIAQAYEKQGDYKQAYQHLQNSVDAKTRSIMVATETRITILKSLYELDVAKRESEFQQAQYLLIQSEIEERLKRQRIEITLEKQLELMDIKNHILTRLNHEFRTPLTILRTSFELLTRYGDRLAPENKIEHVQRIDEQFAHVKDLLDDVLNVIQINDPKDKNIAIMPINLYEFAPSVINLAEKRTRTADRVQLDMQQSQQIIYQNADFLEQIIVNLLTNALKFSQEAVLFQLSTTPDQNLIIRVKDQGIGIPQDEHESVFDVLFRGSNLDEVSGNGIGLALVKQSVGLLDGTIELHSTLNVGTEFIVTIPLKTNPHSPTNGDYPAYHL